MANEKRYYRVCCYAEGSSDGYMLLTKEEAEIVHKTANCENWIHPETEPWSGGLFIDIEHPMTKEEMETDYEKRYGWPEQDDEDDYDSCSYANYYEYADEDAERDGLLEYGLL